MCLPITAKIRRIHCRIFEDNLGAIEIGKIPMMRLREKHMNIKYHHCCDHVKKGLISVHQVSTTEQIADIFTKPLGEALFESHHRSLVGW